MTPPDAPKNIFMPIWDRARGNPVVAILAALLVILLAFFLIVVIREPEWFYRLSGIANGDERKFTALKSLGIAMGGVILAIQAANSHRRAVAMEESARAQARASEAQADAARAQAGANRNAEKGLRQERLKNAIEHLGSESPSIRMGGAHELFHLAEDTEEWRRTIFDILCAHIRRTTGEVEYREKHKEGPSEEIQSLLTLLFVQEHEVFDGLHINLQGSWLNGANLEKARLRKAVLSEAHLQGALLDYAHFQGAVLRRAYLLGANLEAARLQGADLSEAELQGADISGAQVQGANLRRAQLQGAELLSAQLQEANLEAARLQGADLCGSGLQKASLRETQLQGADLAGAHLQGAFLSEAQLQGAFLAGADFQTAYLNDAQLQGVDSSRQEYPSSFAKRIRARIDEKSDFSDVVFSGGLTWKIVEHLVVGLSDWETVGLRTELASHIDKPVSHEPPRNSRAVTGTYTKEQAEGWIAEYEAAMAEVPPKDAG